MIATANIMVATPKLPICLILLIFIENKQIARVIEEKTTSETNFGIFTGSALIEFIKVDVKNKPTRNNEVALFCVAVFMEYTLR